MEHAAWRSAADTVGDLSFEQYRTLLIHETPQIKRFLTETRAEHFIISAPKGFGKTLLLIAKRLQLNEHSPELDHGGEIVDRPSGSFPDVSKDRMNEYRDDFELWRRIWSCSLMLAAINMHARYLSNRHREAVGDVSPFSQHRQLDSWTQEILKARDRYRSPTLIFTALLDVDFTTRQRALNNLNRVAEVFSAVQSQVAFFIDNVDEYFAPTLENHSMAAIVRNSEDNQQKSNQIWINAQLALVAAAFHLHRVNHHVRVYCTVRSEAFQQLHEKTAEYSQILGSAVEISYDRRDLETIFKKNVKLMSMSKDGLFREASPDDPFALFFGPAAKAMKHRLVDSDEKAFDYLLRHTFYRPRDLVTVCGKIALVPVEERNPTRIRDVVNEESTHLVHGLITEMKPFFRLPDPDQLLPSIRRNVLTLGDLNRAKDEYIDKMMTRYGSSPGDWEEEHRHPFCALYQIGMLGWIQVDHRQGFSDVQRFVRPRDVEVAKKVGLPPTEQFYLVHPALDHLVSERVGREYFRQFHRANIVGFDLPWKEPAASLFVVKGDVCGFSKVMESEFYKAVTVKLHEWTKVVCNDLDFVEVEGGDSITLIDRSAYKLVECVDQLLKRAEAYREQPFTFRFGGSAGPISFESVERRINRAWESIQVPLGHALRTSARLEPHAPKGKLMVDGAFADAAALQEKLSIMELLAGDVSTLVYNHETKVFFVQKSTTDPVYKTRLYVVTGAGHA
jgi:hypothetical protein